MWRGGRTHCEMSGTHKEHPSEKGLNVCLTNSTEILESPRYEKYGIVNSLLDITS